MQDGDTDMLTKRLLSELPFRNVPEKFAFARTLSKQSVMLSPARLWFAYAEPEGLPTRQTLVALVAGSVGCARFQSKVFQD